VLRTTVTALDYSVSDSTAGLRTIRYCYYLLTYYISLARLFACVSVRFALLTSTASHVTVAALQPRFR